MGGQRLADGWALQLHRGRLLRLGRAARDSPLAVLLHGLLRARPALLQPAPLPQRDAAGVSGGAVERAAGARHAAAGQAEDAECSQRKAQAADAANEALARAAAVGQLG